MIEIRTKLLGVQKIYTLDQNQERSAEESIEYNLRGIKTYNVLKDIVWSNVLNKPPKDSPQKPMICLPLLKGLLREVRVELAVETYLQRAGFHVDETAPENYF